MNISHYFFFFARKLERFPPLLLLCHSSCIVKRQMSLDHPIESNAIFISPILSSISVRAVFFLCTVIRIILSIREWNFRKQSVFTMRNCSERDTAEGTVTETPMFPLLLPSPTLGCSTENILNVYSLAIYSQVNNTVKYSFRTLFLSCN